MKHSSRIAFANIRPRDSNGRFLGLGGTEDGDDSKNAIGATAERIRAIPRRNRRTNTGTLGIGTRIDRLRLRLRLIIDLVLGRCSPVWTGGIESTTAILSYPKAESPVLPPAERDETR